MTLLHGLDLSTVQGVLRPDEWAKIVASDPLLRFAYLRCGNMNEAPDSCFAENARGASHVGLRVGAYHVGLPLPPDPAHPGREPEEQARRHFADSGGLGSGGGEMPPALDLELPVPGSEEWRRYSLSPLFVRTWALAYLAECEVLYGRLPAIYSFPNYWTGIEVEREPRLARYPCWLADYPAAYQHRWPTDDQLLVVPRPWASWSLWQINDGGMRLPSGAPVDADVFCGGESALAAFCAIPSK